MIAAKDPDQLCKLSWRSPPGSFVSLMTLYESNYIRLKWLLPDLPHIETSQVSHLSGDPSLYLEVQERCPYTTLFNLTYRLPDDAGELRVPDMQVRLYHDARVAEAASCVDSPALESLRRIKGALQGDFNNELKQRWARNMLLNKWLEYCAERGHRFAAAPR